MVERLHDCTVEDGYSIEEIAGEFELSARQFRRIIRSQIGVSPGHLIRTRRLLIARQLLIETSLPIVEIAFASGFASLRRFNDAFKKSYGSPPGELRRRRKTAAVGAEDAETFTLELTYRTPFNWDGILDFLAPRALKGVEAVQDGRYMRTVQIGAHRGYLVARHLPDRCAVSVEFTLSLLPVLPTLLARLRHLFDLDARPDLIGERLAADQLLGPLVEKNPGLRVPGAFDGFELGWRAILGQQVSVRAAATIAGRISEAAGEPFATPFAGLNRLTPTAEAIGAANSEELGALGILRSRSAAILDLARAITLDNVNLEAGSDPEKTISTLIELKGVGPWTAHYIAMRALRWPDAFPEKDVVLLRKLKVENPREAARIAQRWRPWRSYATLYLWQMPD
jgi:AraC family transcriptional regulator of adaptative response / DNA-3-methyladenine glycosylase II